MIRQQKPAVVYLALMKTFPNVRSARDVTDLLSSCDQLVVWAILAFDLDRQSERQVVTPVTFIKSGSTSTRS